ALRHSLDAIDAGIFECAAQHGYCSIDVRLVDHRIRPHLTQQLLPRNDLSVVLKQDLEQVDDFRRNRNDLSVPKQDPLVRVQAKRPEFVKALCRHREKPWLEAFFSKSFSFSECLSEKQGPFCPKYESSCSST